MYLGVVLAVLAAIAYTLNTLFITLLGRKSNIAAIKYILLISVILNVALHFIVYGSFLPNLASWGNAVLLSISAIAGYVLGYVTIIAALPLVGPQFVLLISTTQTVASFIAGWAFLRESQELVGIVYSAFIVAGIVLVILSKRISIPQRRHFTKGLLLSLALAGLQTVSQLLSKKALMSGVTPISANVFRLLVATVVVFAIALFASRTVPIRACEFTVKEWKYIGLAAVTGPVLGIFLSFNALTRMDLGIAAALFQLSPAFMLIIEKILFKERIRAMAILGTAIALSGATLLALL